MKTLPTVNIKGKKYVTVNDRLKYFREAFAGYSLETEIVQLTEEYAVIRAVIRDEKERLIATGVAREFRTDAAAFVNKTSFVENCETSAWGRALANFGIGIDETVASADEVLNAINTKDADTMDNSKEESKKAQPPKAAAPVKAAPVPPKKPDEKPTLTKVLETMTDSKTLERLDSVLVRAKSFQWTEEDMNAIGACYINMKNRLSPKIEPPAPSDPSPDLEQQMADAEREGMKAA